MVWIVLRRMSWILSLAGVVKAMKAAWTLYVFGNGDAIALIFHGLQALVNSQVFVGLVDLVVLIGFGWMVFSSVSQGRLVLTQMVKYLLFSTVFIRILFGAHMNIGVVDVLTPANNQVITGVPWLIGMPAAMLSQMGYALAKQIDVAYASTGKLPGALSLTGAGQGSGAPHAVISQMLRDANHYHIQDPYLKNSLTHFFVDCVTPMVSSGQLESHIVLSSDAIWSELARVSINPALMTVYYGAMDAKERSMHGQVNTCQWVYQQLSGDLKRTDAARLKGWADDIKITAADSLFQNVLSYVAGQKAYASTPGEHIQQAAMLNLLSGPVLRLMDVQAHSSGLMQQLALAQAKHAATSHWVASREIFQATFGYLYAALQVLVYAMAPLVVLFALLPGLRQVVLKRYMQLLAWFPVTFVLMAVANDAMTVWSQALLSQAWSHGGLSLAGKPFISAAVSKMTAVGGWLMTCVPMLSWGLISGVNAGMGAVLGATQAHWFSRGAAMQSATGNAELDHQQYHQTEANDFNMAWHTDLGALPTTLHEAGSVPLRQVHLGGLGVSQQGLSNMQSVTRTVERQSRQASETSEHATQSFAVQKEQRDSHGTWQFTDKVERFESSLRAGISGNGVAGLAAAAMQQYLMHKSGGALSSDTLQHAASAIQSAAGEALRASVMTDDVAGQQQVFQQAQADMAAAVGSLGKNAQGESLGHHLKEELIEVGTIAALVGAAAMLPEVGIAAVGEEALMAGRVLLGGVRSALGLAEGVAEGAAGSAMAADEGLAESAIVQAMKSQGLRGGKLAMGTGVGAGIFAALKKAGHGGVEWRLSKEKMQVDRVEDLSEESKSQRRERRVENVAAHSSVHLDQRKVVEERQVLVPDDNYYEALE